MSHIDFLKQQLADRDLAFWSELAKRSLAVNSFSELLSLSNLRKRALRNGSIPSPHAGRSPVRTALVGGSTLYPLSELVEHILFAHGLPAELFIGDYNNFRSELLDSTSRLYEFQPQIVIVLPDEQSCRYVGRFIDSIEKQQQAVAQHCADTLELCAAANQRTHAEIILCNYILPPYFDLGPYRARTLASDWNFKKAVNLALGTKAPNYVHICDLEFLAYRCGGLAAKDEKAWFESKQVCSPALQFLLAQEIAHIAAHLRSAPKKVLVLDLDNTLWGGVVGDDGLEGIEIGDTSPRGEAFKAFQRYIASLTERGVLLAVSSKNDPEKALEPFRKHPEMVLREEHFVSFKANWEPKSDNLRAIAAELNLGLDSFVFVDDNPAEIEIVRQFVPEVTTISLSDDPSEYVKQLQESRLFERLNITGEDLARTGQYHEEARRNILLSASTNMESYLQSLDMQGSLKRFHSLDLPRIAQLINKSNQFNLTTRRRSEAELAAMIDDPNYTGFSVRLRDRFGDYGLIAVVICRTAQDNILEIDTWLMSCRVLKRQVEEVTLNEIVRIARERGANRIRGFYFPTAKNGMVRGHYPSFGFELVSEDEHGSVYELDAVTYVPKKTAIAMESESQSDDSERSTFTVAGHIR